MHPVAGGLEADATQDEQNDSDDVEDRGWCSSHDADREHDPSLLTRSRGIYEACDQKESKMPNLCLSFATRPIGRSEDSTSSRRLITRRFCLAPEGLSHRRLGLDLERSTR